MSLSSFKLRLTAGHVRLVFADGRGADVQEAALSTVLTAAVPLIDFLEKRVKGPLRAVSVSFTDRILRATYEMSAGVHVLRIDGAQFDRYVVPRCAAVLPLLDAQARL